jgi:hypothetical protein
MELGLVADYILGIARYLCRRRPFAIPEHMMIRRLATGYRFQIAPLQHHSEEEVEAEL